MKRHEGLGGIEDENDKCFVLMLLLLTTASWASAKTEEISVGPFNASFDLNTTENYSVTSNFTTQEGLQSGIIKIESNDGSQAAIGIMAYDRWQYAGFRGHGLHEFVSAVR
jgi:hypothetical protein